MKPADDGLIYFSPEEFHKFIRTQGKEATGAFDFGHPSEEEIADAYDEWILSKAINAVVSEHRKNASKTSDPVYVSMDRGFFTMKDSGTRQEFDTGAQRDAQEGKGIYAHLPHEAIRQLAVHMEHGAKKYDRDNWRKGMPMSRTLESLLRHAHQYADGDRSENHLAAVLFNASVLIETQRGIDVGKLPPTLNDLEIYCGNNE